MDGTELYRKVVLTVSGNRLVKWLSIRYGKKLAGRFIAGDTLEEALDEIERLNGKGILVTLDHLGEGITSLTEASAYREEYIRLVEGIANRGVQSNVSLKPTQMGLALDPQAAYENIRTVVRAAQRHGNFVRLDMEDSPFTQATIDMTLRLHKEGLTNVGTVIQAYLYRSEEDVRMLMKEGVKLRLVKGAYKEPGTIAYQKKQEIIGNYKNLIKLQLDQGAYTAVATHDNNIIDWVKVFAEQNRIKKDAFEFQMLYGLRMKDQARLAQDGYRIRCYMPYGTMWYPYFTRRIAEKPANLMMVLRNMFK
ncbi:MULTISPECIES: proline dehydrogenase family protein [Paenibacillus]|uniref:proline dehydrogenase n=2 Tax=Paenibacillus lactis TaxID=228574 RepID=G4HHQ5_9BACL|nr:proline dehydrogenase family protein [Paenibacillus lactis]EHB63631.1 Proline dehydrogenase [Paenibacillus lactis 154]MBP1891913.1 proline dehydrogenase [Paenibacillus lactis]GIO89153.1 proline dehydrogenase [Paenibacillus lactis]HAF99356.1 proline dehydrogenase [Paenibacillus lactis]